jgi:hypothetical protein
MPAHSCQAPRPDKIREINSVSEKLAWRRRLSAYTSSKDRFVPRLYYIVCKSVRRLRLLPFRVELTRAARYRRERGLVAGTLLVDDHALLTHIKSARAQVQPESFIPSCEFHSQPAQIPLRPLREKLAEKCRLYAVLSFEKRLVAIRDLLRCRFYLLAMTRTYTSR